MHLFIRLGGDLLVEEFQLCRHRAFLQGARCVQAHLGVGGEQLQAGLHVIDQAAQAVVQTHGLGFAVERELALLKGIDQLDTRRVGVGGPVLQEFGLLHRVGGKEVFGVAGVCAQGQQQQQGEDEAVEGSGHIKMSWSCGDSVGAGCVGASSHSDHVPHSSCGGVSCSSRHSPVFCHCPECKGSTAVHESALRSATPPRTARRPGSHRSSPACAGGGWSCPWSG